MILPRPYRPSPTLHFHQLSVGSEHSRPCRAKHCRRVALDGRFSARTRTWAVLAYVPRHRADVGFQETHAPSGPLVTNGFGPETGPETGKGSIPAQKLADIRSESERYHGSGEFGR